MNNDVRDKELTEQQIDDWRRRISKMTRIDMCRLWRFAPSGHPIFNNTLPMYAIFKKRFDKLGGFSPAISKQIGWD